MRSTLSGMSPSGVATKAPGAGRGIPQSAPGSAAPNGTAECGRGNSADADPSNPTTIAAFIDLIAREAAGDGWETGARAEGSDGWSRRLRRKPMLDLEQVEGLNTVAICSCFWPWARNDGVKGRVPL